MKERKGKRMKYCGQCGLRVPKKANFCQRCGAKVAYECDCWVMKKPYSCGFGKCEEIQEKKVTSGKKQPQILELCPGMLVDLNG